MLVTILYVGDGAWILVTKAVKVITNIIFRPQHRLSRGRNDFLNPLKEFRNSPVR